MDIYVVPGSGKISPRNVSPATAATSAAIALRCWCVTHLVMLVLRCGGFPMVSALVPPPRSRGVQLGELQRILRLCRWAWRWSLRTECLVRSIVLCRMLRLYGFPASLCVGTSKSPPLIFHAWVEFPIACPIDDSPERVKRLLVMARY